MRAQVAGNTGRGQTVGQSGVHGNAMVGRLRRWSGRLLALALVVAGVGVWLPQSVEPASAQGELAAYAPVAHWPERSEAAVGLFQTPSDLDVARDGRVYVADPGIGGVHLLLPTGAFTTPFGVSGGFPAQLGQVGAIAVGPDPTAPGFPFGGERVYVVDPALERVAIYSLAGAYVGQWPDVRGQGIAAAVDGTVYVLDRETTQIVAFDAFSGSRSWTWGTRGTEDGQLSSFTDVDVAPDGKVLAVGDKRGLRVQLFDVTPRDEVATGQPPLSLRRVYDLRDAKYNQQSQACSGERVNALGGDQVFMGEGEGACLVDARSATFAIAASANRSTICRETVALPRLRADSQLYFALAESNANPGKCGDKRGNEDPVPVVVSYNDTQLRQVSTVFQAQSNDDSDTPVLFSPESLAMSDAEHIFVADSSSKFRFFTRDGQQVATAARESATGQFSGDFEFFRIQAAAGAEVMGEVFGYYLNFRRTGGVFDVKAGVGRFKTVEKRTQTGLEEVIEPIWTDQLASSFQQLEIPAIAFNPTTGELLTLRTETVPAQRTTDVLIARYSPDGRTLKPSWDLPDDGQSNPYADMVVGPDGRVYALDDLNDVVRVLEADGTPVRDVPVAFDARSIAAGPPAPDGQIFALREPGVIERYADDGRITARLDGRPLPFSDPTTLSDLVVDGEGRVYVSDGQASLITVLERVEDADALPVPEDGKCLFRGQQTVTPARLNVGETADVRLSLDGRCGINEDPTDIVVLVPYYSRLQQGVDPSATVITDMLRMMARVNFGQHRVGIVSYYNTVTTELALTTDRDAYIAAAQDVTRFDPASDQVRARLRDAMAEGAKLFDDPGRRRVMVLLRALYCDPAIERFPGECQGYPPAGDTALQIRESGVNIVVLYGFSAFDLASSDEDALFNLDGVHKRMVRYRVPTDMIDSLTLTSRLPASLTVDPASFTAGGVWQAPNVVWNVENVGYDGLQAGMTIVPTEGGTWPISEDTVAELTDGWGASQRVSFPIPNIEVIGPTPTSVAPTATSAASPTPLASATPRPPVPVFLPIAHVERCKVEAVPLEVVMVMDTSSSMSAATEPGGPSKLQAAQDAAAAFVDALRPEDRAAVVGFDRAARLAMPLTLDHAAAHQAIDGLVSGTGTALDLGLRAGLAALGDSRPEARQVLVLLTDGRPSTGYEAFRSAATDVRDAGVTLFAIGLGQDVDGTLLAAVVGDPARYFHAPSTTELEPVFEDLKDRTRVVCP